jgi:hypothetical protein
MRLATKGWGWYFAISIPIKLDLLMHGPLSTMLSAATGLPIS